jgi:hypothetical protein
MEYLEANLDWLLASLRALGEDAYVLFDIPGQVELSTNHPSLRRILEALGKDGWRVSPPAGCRGEERALEEREREADGGMQRSW